MVPLNQIRLKASLYVACFLMLFFFSCSRDANTLFVEHHNFIDEVSMTQNLIFTFDKEICPDSLFGKFDTTSYIQFKPAVKGIYRWMNSRELMFIPENGFLPCTTYDAQLKDLIPAIDKKHQYRMDAEAHYIFHTPFLSLTSANGFWEASEIKPDEAVLKLDINFNMNVSSKDLKGHIMVKTGDKNLPVQVISDETTDHFKLLVNGIESFKSEYVPIKIIITKGMGCEGSNYKTPKDLQTDLLIAPPSKLEIASSSGIYEGEQMYIEVLTNQPVTEDEVQKNVNITGYQKISTSVSLLPNGFRLQGEFNDYTTYHLEISEAFTGRLGGKLDESYSKEISFSRQESSIKFTYAKGLYIGSKGAKNLSVNVVNISKVKVTIYKIFENNLNLFLADKRNSDYNESGNIKRFGYYTYDLDRYGSKVREEIYNTKDLALHGNSRLLHINTDAYRDYKGVYLFMVESGDENSFISDAKLVSVSDVGLIARKSANDVWVFANSIQTTKPISNLKVKLISTNNQLMGESVTNDDGVAVFSHLNERTKDFIPGMVTSHLGNDFNYMMFNDAEVQQSRFDVDGYRLNSSGLQTYIYGDRDMYRPGETIHTRYIIRNENWEPPKGYPIKIKVLNPNGQELKVVQQKLNELGSTGLDISLPQSALTGTYTFEIFTANDVLLASKGVSVEEFMPDRIDVKTILDKKIYTLSDSLQGKIQARNFFGPPAANRKYEYEVSLSYKRFASETYKDYQFDLVNNHYLNFNKEVATGTTDGEGNARVSYRFPSEIANTGLLNGMLFTTVFDETGRPVHRSSVFDLYTQNIFIGAKQTDYWYSVRDQVRIPLIAVNKEGKAVSTRARVKLVQVEWFSWMTNGDDGYSVRSNGKEKVISDKMVQIGAGGVEHIVSPGYSGDYEVRIYTPGSEAYTAVRFSAWGWGYTDNNAFEVNNEGTITIESDKKSYQSGEEAKLLFKTPFSGRMLVTVEREKITEYHYIQTDKKSASINIKMKDEHCPNVYISATLFHASDDGSMPLTVAHGYISLKVEKANLKLPVQILAVEKTRSHSKQQVRIKTTPGNDAEVTIAVIDEGILSIKGYETPDPYEFFYQKRGLSVTGYDIYPFLMPDIGGKKSKTGGDGYELKAMANQDRANPLANNRINLIAYWSGAIKANAAGEAIYTFDIPQFSGSLRVMAVVHKGKAFGHAEKKMTVSDPVILSPAIPRFLSPGDTAYIPVMYTNTTNGNISGVSKIKVSGNLVVSGIASQNIQLKANSESRVVYKVYSRGMGHGQIDIEMSSAAERYTHTTDITIRPSAGLQKSSIGGFVKSGESGVVNLANQYIPAFSKAKLVVSRSPMIQFAKNLDYLVAYPYGCVEQTTSAAFPQLYLAELMPLLPESKGNKNNSTFFVQEAIKKLSGMQLYNGALSYWPGQSYESFWGTAYAAHFLIEARKAGYDVNNHVVDRCVEYLQGKLRYKETLRHRIYMNNSWQESNIYLHEYAYSLYVLALAGKPDVSSMNFMKANLNMLTAEGRFMLAAAYATQGDLNAFKVILQYKNTGYGESMFGGAFYSRIREMAMSLNILCEKDINNPAAAQLVRDLSNELKDAQYINTQEAAWALMALGKYTKRTSTGNEAMAEISAGGVKVGSFAGKDLVIENNILGKQISIKATGKGNIYYFYAVQGITADGSFKEVDSKLKIRRSYLDRNGRPIDILNLKQNDLLVVKLSVSALENRYIENVVVTDMLPAGFEIENPRISAVPDITWVKDAAIPDYYDVRDDRINFFTPVSNQTKNFYYLVRCVSPGVYQLGSASADAMYREEYRSMNGGGKVVIR